MASTNVLTVWSQHHPHPKNPPDPTPPSHPKR